MYLKPDMYKKDIFDINYKKLKSMGKKYLFFDLDNTLVSYGDNRPNDRIINLFKKLKKEGFECFIFSNSGYDRLKPFKDELDVEVYCSSMKPLNKNYKKIKEEYDISKCVFIGDQIMTDVLGAKRNKCFVIFVDRINEDEPIYTKFWRFFESIILKKYKKKKIFTKGSYYE